MKEARFVSQNKEKWGKMENVNHLDTDTLASNYVILSDDLSYAKTFYPGSDVVKYLNQLISVYQINIYGQERSGKKGILSFWVREFPLLLYRERRTLLFAFLFCLDNAFYCFDAVNGTHKRMIKHDSRPGIAHNLFYF